MSVIDTFDFFGAPPRTTRRFVFEKRRGEEPLLLFEVFRGGVHRVLDTVPILEENVLAQVGDNAVTVLDVINEPGDSDSWPDVLKSTMSAIATTVLPLREGQNATDLYGKYVLLREDWDNLSAEGTREDIIRRARAVARRLGLAGDPRRHMSDDALYETLMERLVLFRMRRADERRG